MSKQENFNDILRSKFIERDIPANDEDWRKMRKTIDDSRRRKRRIVWISLSSVLSLMLGFSIYEYTTTIALVNNKPVQTVAKESNDIKNAISNTAVVVTPINKEGKESTKETASGNPAQTTGPKSEKAISRPIVASAEPEKKSFVKTATVYRNTNHIAGTKTVKQSSYLHNKANTRQSSEVTQLDKIPSANSKATMNLVASSSLPEKNTDNALKKEMVTESLTTPVVTSGTSKISSKSDSTSKNQALVQETNYTKVNSGATEVSKKADSSAIKQPVAGITKNNVPAPKPDSVRKKADSIPAPQAISELVVAPLPPIEGKSPKKNSFSIEAGAGYSLGWNYSDTSQGRGVNPTIGIGYTRILSPKFALKTGLQISTVGNMGSSPFIIKHVTYDFSYNSNDTSLKTQWLFYLTVPLQVEYKLDEKDAIGLGGTLSYLLSGYGQVSVSSSTGDVSRTTKAYSQFMYVKGFNQWNASVFLLYKRTLFGKLSMYIIPYFGLMDIKSNSFFNRNKFERDSGLKLLLSYTIL